MLGRVPIVLLVVSGVPRTQASRACSAAARAWPTTAFYDASGQLALTHIGAYASQAKADEELREHALS